MRPIYICRYCGKPAKPPLFEKLDDMINVPVCIVCKTKNLIKERNKNG